MVYEQICRAITEIMHIPMEELSMDTRFVEDLGADSLTLYQIIIFLENELDIELENSIRDVKVRSIKDLCDWIHAAC